MSVVVKDKLDAADVEAAVKELQTRALLTAGANASYTVATNGVQTLMAAVAVARYVMIHVLVDEVFANGDGAQPTFTFGETDTATKFGAASLLTGAAAGTKISLAGVLSANKALIVTAVAGTGTTMTGGISVTAIAAPATT